MRKKGGRLVAEETGFYRVTSNRVAEEHILEVAGDIMERRVMKGERITNPKDMSNFLRVRLGYEEREVFGVVFLTNRHRVIAFERMFHGTIDGASVHPREVVKRALELNAAALVFSHNHPSSDPEPSLADQQLTNRLKDALSLVDVRVLDHIVVCPGATVSFAERGLL